MLSLTSYLKTLGKRGLMAFAVQRTAELDGEEQDEPSEAAKTEELADGSENAP